MKQILLGLLLHCFFLTAKPECIYYENDDENYSTINEVICRNMHLKKGDVLKLEGQTEPDDAVNHLSLEGVSGVLNKRTIVSFFPRAYVVIIKSSTIEKLRLASLRGSLVIDNTTLSGANPSQFWKYCCLNIGGLLIYSSKVPGSIEHFKSLKQLQLLILSNTNESFIPKHLTKSTFESISSVKGLSLNKVGLEEVDEDAFENLPNLKRLRLRNNTITQIKPNTFKSLTNLEELDLIGNNIQNLSLEMLSEQKKLKSLSLPYKIFLKFGAKETKKALPNLKDISLDKYSPEWPVVKSFVSIGIYVYKGATGN